LDKNRIKDIDQGYSHSDIIMVDPYDKEDYIDRRYMSILNTKPYGMVENAAKNKWINPVSSTQYTNFDEIILKLD